MHVIMVRLSFCSSNKFLKNKRGRGRDSHIVIDEQDRRDSLSDRQTDRQKNRLIDRQKDGPVHIDKQIDRQIDRQTDRQIFTSFLVDLHM